MKLKIRKPKIDLKTAEEEGEKLYDSEPEEKKKLKLVPMPPEKKTEYYKSSTPQKANIIDERANTREIGKTEMERRRLRMEYELMLKNKKNLDRIK